MVGGRFKIASVASIAAAGMMMGGVSAQAADLGGNCCADLEERVAELEATTARKGNRRVSLEVSGHINEAIVFWDVDSIQNGLDEFNFNIGTHNASRSRFRFRGSANINADWSAGFLLEIGVRANHLAGTNQATPKNTAGLDIRHEALWVRSKTMGTVWLGWTSSAADGITEICLGCGLGNGPDFSDDMAGLRATALVGGNQTFGLWGSNAGAFMGEGDRREIIRYISPTIAGFVVSAAAGPDDFWDVALRYAGEFGSFRVAGGIAYQKATDGVSRWGIAENSCSTGGTWQGLTGNPNVADTDCESLGMSASVQHTPTGLYVAGAFGAARDNTVPAVVANVIGDEGRSWHVTVGVNQKWSSLGNTNIWAMYTESRVDGGIFNTAAAAPLGIVDRELTVYGVGIEQNIDAAAMNLYLWYKHMDVDASFLGASANVAESDQIVMGARIRF